MGKSMALGFLCVAMLVFLIGCGDVGNDAVETSESIAATGSVSGIAQLNGSSTGNTGIMVYIAGTHYVALTDNEGAFSMDGIPSGTEYELIATKDGYTDVSKTVDVSAENNTDLGILNMTFSAKVNETHLIAARGMPFKIWGRGLDVADVWFGREKVTEVISVSASELCVRVPEETPLGETELTIRIGEYEDEETVYGSEPVYIKAGQYHSLALDDTGEVTAWGYNNYGQSTVPTWLNLFR